LGNGVQAVVPFFMTEYHQYGIYGGLGPMFRLIDNGPESGPGICLFVSPVAESSNSQVCVAEKYAN
jgi:hypothetical protein